MKTRKLDKLEVDANLATRSVIVRLPGGAWMDFCVEDALDFAELLMKAAAAAGERSPTKVEEEEEYDRDLMKRIRRLGGGGRE